MNLFKGLEKFGLKTEGTENLFEEEKRTNASTEQERQKKKYLLRNHSVRKSSALHCVR